MIRSCMVKISAYVHGKLSLKYSARLSEMVMLFCHTEKKSIHLPGHQAYSKLREGFEFILYFVCMYLCVYIMGKCVGIFTVYICSSAG